MRTAHGGEFAGIFLRPGDVQWRTALGDFVSLLDMSRIHFRNTLRRLLRTRDQVPQARVDAAYKNNNDLPAQALVCWIDLFEAAARLRLGVGVQSQLTYIWLSRHDPEPGDQINPATDRERHGSAQSIFDMRGLVTALGSQLEEIAHVASQRYREWAGEQSDRDLVNAHILPNADLMHRHQDQIDAVQYGLYLDGAFRYASLRRPDDPADWARQNAAQQLLALAGIDTAGAVPEVPIELLRPLIERFQDLLPGASAQAVLNETRRLFNLPPL